MKIVLVGLGRMGRNHLRVLRELPGVTLVAVIDVAAKAEPDLGAPLLRSIDELDGVAWDAAVVATPTATHFDVAKLLIERGKHLLIEKPIASTHTQALALLEAAERRGVRVAVGHVERFNPAVRKLREVLAAGWLGDPVHFSFTRVGGYPDTLVQGNNVLLDLAVHDVDVLRTFVGPLRLEAALCHSTWKPGVYDTAEIFVSGASGASASIHVNWVTPTKIRGIRVTGTKGVVFVDYILQTCELLGGQLLRATEPSSSSFENIQEHYRISDRVQFGIAKEEPLRVQHAQFLKWLEGGEPGDLCLVRAAYAAVVVAERAMALGAERAQRKAPRMSIHSGELPVLGDEWI
jgi:UDP-N-acetylglucosamine 3-dehydrogenase